MAPHLSSRSDMYDISKFSIKKEPVILGIESSCDETACAVLRGRKILSDRIISSAAEQAIYGGVVPEIASRMHTEAVDEVCRLALADAGLAPGDVDCIAATYGAGLLGALLVGLSFAKAFAFALGVPFVAVNHIRGHIAAAYLDKPDLEPPFVTLLASGGHTAILHTETFNAFRVLASTSDDAAGEAFDKCARVLGLPYPGGPSVQKLAAQGRPVVKLPSALVKNSETLRFSYSGLKTAVLNTVHNARQRGEWPELADIAASFQCAAIDPLVKKTVELALKCGVKTVTAGGGVVANDYLRSTLSAACKKAGLALVLPEKRHCTDNAAMIASEGLNKYMAGEFSGLDVNAAAAIAL